MASFSLNQSGNRMVQTDPEAKENMRNNNHKQQTFL